MLKILKYKRYAKWMIVPAILMLLGYSGFIPLSWAQRMLGWSLPGLPAVESASATNSDKVHTATGQDGLSFPASVGRPDSQFVSTSRESQFGNGSVQTLPNSSNVQDPSSVDWDPPGGNTNGQFAPNSSNTNVFGGGANNTTAGPLLQPASNPGMLSSNRQVTQVPANRSIIVGTFNVEVFGQAKLGNESVMRILTDIGRRFDVLAIQEIRSVNDVIPQFVEMLNAAGHHYTYYVGPRQGYTISKEQYAFIFDANKLRLLEEPYVVESDRMHRPPLVAHFQSIEVPSNQAFTFCLLDVHTDPDDVRNELAALRDLMPAVQKRHAAEDDFIIVGDFNAPTDFLQLFELQPNTDYVVQEQWVTNTRENQNYDNMIFNGATTREFDGRSGVFNFRRDYQLSLEEALMVSDHLPVWATFSVFEKSASPVADQGASLDFRR